MRRLTADEIRAAIPHRAPFLWIDEVLEMDATRILARTTLNPQLDVFRGHYPDFPVFPGVLLCEMCFQAGAILIACSQAIPAGQVPVVTRINNVKFRHMVRPGETLDIEAVLGERLSNAYFLAGKVTSDNRTVVQLEFACATTPAP
jgi:3-hydroxyacyl-[acyl-carrier-protein] dehydratase